MLKTLALLVLLTLTAAALLEAVGVDPFNLDEE